MSNGAGILKMVSQVEHPDGPFKTIKEVANIFGRDKYTIRRWCQKIGGIPTHAMSLGDENSQAFVRLYTEEDIARLREYSKTVRPGRPKQTKEAG